jgi:hypothetical protein
VDVGDRDGHRPAGADPSRALVGRVEVDGVEPECLGQLGPGAGGGFDPPPDGGGVAGGDLLVRVEQVRVVVGGSEVDGDALDRRRGYGLSGLVRCGVCGRRTNSHGCTDGPERAGLQGWRVAVA